MCEIALIVFLCRSLGESLRAKGRNPILFQTLFAVTTGRQTEMRAFLARE